MGTPRSPELETVTDLERLTILAKFLRNQAALSDRPPVGRVELNNEETLLIADVLDDYITQAGAIQNPVWRWSALAEFFKRHALISKAEPRCFVCDGPSFGWPPAKQHPDLPNIIVCKACLTYATAPRMKEPV